MNSIERGKHPERPTQGSLEGFAWSEEQQAAAIDTRLATADLKELGWRDRPELSDLMRQLEVLAATNWHRAAQLWDKYRPNDPDKPLFIDGDDVDPNAITKPDIKDKAPKSIQKANGRNESQEVLPPPILAKRYLIARNRYYFRDKDRVIAFEDRGKRLITKHEDPLTARSMVELAVAKGWTSIRVKGSETFRREAWLAASLKGIEVTGYKPHETELARLAEMRKEIEPNVQNAIEQGAKRERTIPRTKNSAEHQLAGSRREPDETPKKLTTRQAIAVETLVTILRERGDSEVAIAMAAQMAEERFKARRVYIGQLLDHGPAPYAHDKTKPASYYVQVLTADGEKTIWGTDLQRAIAASGAVKGQEVALVHQGARQATHWERVMDSNGKPTGELVKRESPRNDWAIQRVDDLRKEAREELRSQSKVPVHREPVIRIYDKSAPVPRPDDVVPGDLPGPKKGPQPQPQR